MLGVVGCLFPEIVGKGAWYELDNLDLTRLSLIAMQVIAPLEYWRGNGGFGWNGEEEGRDRSYPGFDPLNITDEGTKNGEIRNGRLAMTALVGFVFQHNVTHQSPIENFTAHLADPVGANIVSNLLTPPVAMFATSGHKDGLWFPGAKAPAHLTGEYPADRGFDPLGLAVDPEVYARMRLSEVFHGRLAMFGVVGCLVPELLGKGAWFEAGNSVDGTKLGLILMCIAAPTEYWRGQGGFGWDKGDMDRSYPGFDPLKLTTDRTKVAEIKNGRLAMCAIAGFAAQYQLNGQSPLGALASHVADPLHANISSSLAMF
jgi:light-harvesting complex I chlorophyll a/b binding protein 1